MLSLSATSLTMWQPLVMLDKSTVSIASLYSCAQEKET